MSKYNATPTTVDGIRFASKREATRYQELLLLLKAGEIQGLQLQPRWKIQVNGVLICTYRPDFTYHTKDEDFVMEDVKGVLTPAYKLKKKLMLAVWGVAIQEVP
jgi:hypothetical protein